MRLDPFRRPDILGIRRKGDDKGTRGNPLVDEEAEGDTSGGLKEPTGEVPTLEIEEYELLGEELLEKTEPTGEEPAVNL